jgi:hypothetical protein
MVARKKITYLIRNMSTPLNVNLIPLVNASKKKRHKVIPKDEIEYPKHSCIHQRCLDLLTGVPEAEIGA